jgi:hypothetical protein
MLSNDEIESKIAGLDNGWELKDGKIVKSFQSLALWMLLSL